MTDIHCESLKKKNMEKVDNIFEESLRKVSEGAKFNVNLKARSLKVDGKYVIENGAFSGVLGVPEYTDKDEMLLDVYHFYELYKHSRPSERNDARQHRYFNALRESALDDEDMRFGEQREYAQARLEIFVLCLILNGSFTWDDSWGKWFWQSQDDKDLVILKKWIV